MRVKVEMEAVANLAAPIPPSSYLTISHLKESMSIQSLPLPWILKPVWKSWVSSGTKQVTEYWLPAGGASELAVCALLGEFLSVGALRLEIEAGSGRDVFALGPNTHAHGVA